MANDNCSCGCEFSIEQNKAVVCCICSNNYNPTCVKLTVAEARTINNKNKGCSWSCNECRSLGGSINELRAAIINLKKEIQTLQVRKTETFAEPDFESIIQEVGERFERRHNVVIFNQPEIESHNSQERNDYDMTTTKSILNALSTNIVVDRIQVQRIGKYNKDRPRPIKVRLENVSDVHTVIKNAKRLKDSRDFKHVSVSYDRTPLQAKYYRDVKAAFDARIAAGEENLRIRYKNGLPVIESLN